MQNATFFKQIETVYHFLRPLMDERLRRQWAAAEAKAYGWGGIQAVSVATGLSMTTIRKGMDELSEREAHPERAFGERVRKARKG
jgi:hypothetical protein